MTDVHLYVQETLADWEPGFAIAEINSQRFGGAVPPRYRVRTVGDTREPVRTMGGITVLPDLALADLDPGHRCLLILAGRALWDRGEGDAALAKAKQFLDAGVPVAAICGATYGLARAGLLNDRRHTSAALEYLKGAPGYRGEDLYRDVPAVTDSNLITAGPTDPVEFAREILALLEVYEKPVLDAWYGLFSTSQPRYFLALMEATAGGTGEMVSGG
jgi:putative intracellular protease/amidase